VLVNPGGAGDLLFSELPGEPRPAQRRLLQFFKRRASHSRVVIDSESNH